MISFGKNIEAFVKFNEGALNHPKVRTVIADGRAFVEEHEQIWDAIFVDLPEPSTEYPEIGKLFSVEFFTLLKKRLAPSGVINISCPSLAVIPEYFWGVQATLKAAGFHVLPYHFDVLVDYEGDYGFCLASKGPLSPEEISVSVPTRFLSAERIRDMFYIPYNYRKFKTCDQIQTDDNQVLAKIVEEK
jgi:spermidine synthase